MSIIWEVRELRAEVREGRKELRELRTDVSEQGRQIFKVATVLERRGSHESRLAALEVSPPPAVPWLTGWREIVARTAAVITLILVSALYAPDAAKPEIFKIFADKLSSKALQ